MAHITAYDRMSYRDKRYIFMGGDKDMGRPGYVSLYADERTQRIFDDFVRIKGITKSTALSEMMEIYMLSQDERLYIELKKAFWSGGC